MGETSKAHVRRLREGWYDRFAPAHLSGIDIGCGDDPLNHTFRRWDHRYGCGDATLMEGVPDNTFMTVYASHILEHLDDYRRALRRWFAICRPDGHLIVCVPHRDLYERRFTLPSLWNQEHKTFWLPDREELPCTKSLIDEVAEAIPNGAVIGLRVLNEGYVDPGPEIHAEGEFSIEVIIRK